MSALYQLVDAIVAIGLGGLVVTLLGTTAPGIAITTGVLVACTYYFSRNPWGSPDGEKYNERIDNLYDRLLPF